MDNLHPGEIHAALGIVESSSAALVATLALVLAGGTLTANAATLPGAVTGLKIVFHKTDASFSWDAASNATKYAVVLEPLGALGPFPPTVLTSATSVNISYKSFPSYKTNKKGWEFVVAGENSAGSGKSATAKSGLKITSKGSKVTSSSSSTLAKKINACLDAGETAALATGAGGLVVAVVAIWVPVVGEVTAAGVAVAMLGAGVGTFVVCVATT